MNIKLKLKFLFHPECIWEISLHYFHIFSILIDCAMIVFLKYWPLSKSNTIYWEMMSSGGISHTIASHFNQKI